MGTFDKAEAAQRRLRALPYFLEIRHNISDLSEADFYDTIERMHEYHKSHPNKDSEVHHAALMQLLVDQGIPALMTIKIVDELILKDE